MLHMYFNISMKGMRPWLSVVIRDIGYMVGVSQRSAFIQKHMASDEALELLWPLFLSPSLSRLSALLPLPLPRCTGLDHHFHS